MRKSVSHVVELEDGHGGGAVICVQLCGDCVQLSVEGAVAEAEEEATQSC